MRKLLFMLSAAFAIMTSFSSLTGFEVNVETDFAVGFRQDNLNWSIGDDLVHTVSKLDWKNLQMIQYRAEIRGSICNQMYFRGYGDYAHITDGKNTDSDFAIPRGASEAILVVKSMQDAGKGEVYDASFAIGYQFTLFRERLLFFPLLGYSYHEQHLRLYNAKLILDLIDHAEGSVDNLDSHYRTRWQGPWIGFDVAYDIPCDLNLFGSFEYHWAQYNAKGHWNLRRDFIDDFKHSGDDVSGVILSAGMSWNFFCNWVVGVLANYQTWELHHGRDKTFFPPELAPFLPNSSPVQVSRLNNVYWNSYSINGFVGVVF